MFNQTNPNEIKLSEHCLPFDNYWYTCQRVYKPIGWAISSTTTRSETNVTDSLLKQFRNTQMAKQTHFHWTINTKVRAYFFCTYAFDPTVDTGQLLQKKVPSTLQWTQGSYYKRRCTCLAHVFESVKSIRPPFPQSRPLMCLLKRFPTWSWHLKKREDERGPSSIRRTLQPFQRQRWRFPST